MTAQNIFIICASAPWRGGYAMPADDGEERQWFAVHPKDGPPYSFQDLKHAIQMAMLLFPEEHREALLGAEKRFAVNAITPCSYKVRFGHYPTVQIPETIMW